MPAHALQNQALPPAWSCTCPSLPLPQLPSAMSRWPHPVCLCDHEPATYSGPWVLPGPFLHLLIPIPLVVSRLPCLEEAHGLQTVRYHLHPLWKWKSLSRVQLFATPWTVHGILQARILECVAFPFSRGSSRPRDWTQVSHITGGFLPTDPWWRI